MVVLQRTALLRVALFGRKNLGPQVTSTQQTDYGLMTVLQCTTRLMVGARPQAVGSPVTKKLTYVDNPLHRGEESLKIHPVRKRSEPYLEDPARSGIANVRETNMPMKQKLHLIP